MSEQRRLSLHLLSDAVVGQAATVARVAVPAGRDDWAQQLEDLGFMPGESVTLMARGLPGGDPMVVRVGLSTYALRRAEAACVHITPTVPQGG